jgi:hypothetical protein
MRRLLKAALLLLPLAALYVAWPIYTALQIRDAMVAGDTDVLNRKVEWDSLRASLKSSLSPETIQRLAQDPDAPKRTIWQNIKAAIAPKLADSVIDRYVTPEQLPVFLGYREVYRGTVRPAVGLEEPATALSGTVLAGGAVDRFVSFWRRVRRAVLQSPTRMAIEVEDKYRPHRRYIGTLELKGLEWKLTGLSVSGL